MASCPIVASGIYGQHEIAILMRVFDVVTDYEWFSKSRDCRERFAAYILRTYSRGIHDPAELETHCASMALERFSCAKPNASRSVISGAQF